MIKLAINETARRLNLPSDTLERWIRQGRIPIRKEGNTCIFEGAVLEKWAGAHNIPFSPPEKEAGQPQEDAKPETLLSAMTRGGVFHNITGNSVKAVLRSATERIPFLSAEDKEELLKRLIERENLTSTGIGRGVAIPHPRTPLSDPISRSAITTCFLEKPTEFGAVDNKPVFVMFILLSPSVKTHLHLLSRLAFCVRDDAFVEFLKTTPESDALFSKIDQLTVDR